MEGNGTETKYMLNSAICVQKRPSPLKKKALQSQNMTLPRNGAMVQFILCKEITVLCRSVKTAGFFFEKSVLFSEGCARTDACSVCKTNKQLNGDKVGHMVNFVVLHLKVSQEISNALLLYSQQTSSVIMR